MAVSRRERHERTGRGPHPGPRRHLGCRDLQHLPDAAAQRAPGPARSEPGPAAGPYSHLIADRCSCATEIQKQLSLMKNGEGGLSIFLGLSGTKEELGLKADNYWIFTENNFDEL